jgi:hypothetical protein
VRTLAFIVALLAAVRAGGQEPTGLYDCVDDADGPGFCTRDSTPVLVDAGCGATFNRYHGRISWPVLRNVGPVTISVKTRVRRFPETQTQYLPLYLEVVGRTFTNDDYRCRPLGGIVILVAQGGPDCGGAWESVGPISLVRFGVPLGALYHIQTAFFESRPPANFCTIGFSCLRVTPEPNGVATVDWGIVKSLYK